MKVWVARSSFDSSLTRMPTLIVTGGWVAGMESSASGVGSALGGGSAGGGGASAVFSAGLGWATLGVAEAHLVHLLRFSATALSEILHRDGIGNDDVANGEFDATKEESDEWARSPSGQEAASHLSPEMRAVLGLSLLN